MIISKKINLKQYKEKEFYRKMNAKLNNQKYVPEPLIDFKFKFNYKLN
jgi:hypothetical protein